jgi:hypothetical protein
MLNSQLKAVSLRRIQIRFVITTNYQ